MSEKVWAVWFGGGSGESEEGGRERERRGERRFGGKKKMAERRERTKADVRVRRLSLRRRLFVYGFPVSLYDRKYGQSCRSIKRIDVSIRIFPN